MHRLAFWLALSLGGAASPTGAAPSGLWTGPYQDVSLAPVPLAAPAWLPAPAPGRVLVWAFATGTCGHERWRANDDAAGTEAFARAGVAEMLRRGQDYVVSTGGAGSMSGTRMGNPSGPFGGTAPTGGFPPS